MEEKIIITRQFRKNILNVYQYLLKEFSAKAANEFLDRVEKRIDFIAKNPEIGKLSVKENNIRSIIVSPHNRIYYRYFKNVIEILCLFDMRQDPKKKPY